MAFSVRCGYSRPIIRRCLSRGVSGGRRSFFRQARASWAEERIRVVLCHELAHIGRQDWVVQMLAELLRAVYWFNPLVWIASRRLRQESEQACDDAVLSLGINGVDGPEYAEHLLALARDVCRHRRTFPRLPAPAMVSLMRPSSLERRVRAMLNTGLNRNPTTRLTRAITTVGVFGMSVLIVGFGAAAQTFSTFSGSVVDPMNGLIPKATLILTDVVRQAKHEVRTDDNGHFEFVGLPPGDYLFEVRFAGFGTLKGSVNVAGQNVHKNLELQVGTLQETISVKGKPGSVPASGPPVVIAAQVTPRRGAEGCSVSPTSATGGNIRPPSKLKDVRPVYPAHLLDASVAGAVILDGRIGPDGAVKDVQVLKAAHPELATAAGGRGPSVAIRCDAAQLRPGGCHHQRHRQLQRRVVSSFPRPIRATSRAIVLNP